MTDDALPPWTPSDTWVEGLARAYLGLPRDEAVHPETVRAWRRKLLLAVDDARPRPRRPVVPWTALPRRTGRRAEDVSAAELVAEMVASPWGAAAVQMCLAMPRLLDAVATSERRRRREEAGFRGAVRDEAAPVVAYLRYKLRGGPLGERPLPVYVAAANGATAARARTWEEALAGTSEAATRGALDDMEDVGRRASEAARPLRLWEPEPGPPRGLWPDPAPPEDPAPDRQEAGSGAAPPFVPGRR